MIKKPFKKISVVFMVLAVFTTTTCVVMAAQYCWNKAPFSDIVKLNLSYPVSNQYLLHGSQENSGSYVIPMTGSGVVGEDGKIELVATFVHNGSSFSGNTILSEIVKLDPVTFSGAGTLYGANGSYDPSVSTWAPFDCDMLDPSYCATCPTVEPISFPGSPQG